MASPSELMDSKSLSSLRLSLLAGLVVFVPGCGATALPQARTLREVPKSAKTLPNVRSATSVDLGRQVARRDATVLVFWSPSCPCVGRYQKRLHTLRNDFATRNVGFFAIASNAGESVAYLREGAQGFSWPLLWDRHGHLAQSLGARSTPTVVILRRSGEVAFRGWIDNEHDTTHPARQAWTRTALNALLAGKLTAPHSTRVYGCAITRDPNAPKPVCGAPKRLQVRAIQRCGGHGGPGT